MCIYSFDTHPLGVVLGEIDGEDIRGAVVGRQRRRHGDNARLSAIGHFTMVVAKDKGVKHTPAAYISVTYERSVVDHKTYSNPTTVKPV
jgi:hypothetical protein